MEPEFLVVGLGNPGEKYADTPHNLGFKVVEKLAERNFIRVTRKENISYVGLGTFGPRPVALAMPQTYMNESGPSVKGLLERYELKPDRLVVVYDELDLPFGSLRIKPKGSAAGHNGMKSIIGSLGTNEFVRVRLGVRPELPAGRSIGEGAKFVLTPFKKGQKQEVDEVVNTASLAVESIIAEGVEKTMAAYNRRAQGLKEEEP